MQVVADAALPNPLRRTHQQRASDPAASVWVEASAGTGKTRILTDRVLRLLLDGSEPARILCLTFTNAAAAEMAIRVNERLSSWTVLADAELKTDIETLTGHRPDDAQMARARSLFASVLDAPGGLRIQTIHAFCQSLLARFPIEAAVSPHFTVMEERSAIELFNAAQENVFAALARDDQQETIAALGAVSERVRENTFAEIMAELSLERGRLQSAFDAAGGLTGLLNVVRTLLQLGENDSESAILAAAGDETGFDAAGLRDAAAGLQFGGEKDAPRGAIIAAWLANPDQRAAQFDAYLRAYFKEKGRGDRFASLIHSKASHVAPGADQILSIEATRLATIREKIRTVRLFDATAALVRLGAALIDAYDVAKRRSAKLDYDDLILKAKALLERGGAASWVLFKLDGGLDHILIDEAQDTNPDQWAVIAALAEEFFVGESARDEGRTIFAVGDPKQSIYSFQRADPTAFARWQDFFEDRARASGQVWYSVPLARSYRSSPVILDCVDRVFAQPGAAAGLRFGSGAIEHVASRRGQAGLVELWPVEAPIERDDEVWTPPVERVAYHSPRVELAQKIARQITWWLDRDERLKSRDRPITPGDILVLVQRRSGFVPELIRALKERDLPVAGTDRMVLTDQLAVRDLISLGRFALLPDDDLTLAELLKSPFVGFSEEMLFELAYGRRRGLWATLVERSGENLDFSAARAKLAAFLARADKDPPYEFFATALIAEGGRRELVHRLGPQANDPIDEFLSQALSYQRSHTPSLEGFLHWLESSEAEVRRDMEFGRDEVRIMTVHGAKGLEAPIVFLPDTCRVPRQDSRLLWLPTATAGEVPLWPPRREFEVGVAAAARDAARTARTEEYRRLLYVAMTRAEDRLYVGGWTATRLAPDCWYNLIRNGLQDLTEPSDLDIGGNGLRVVGDQSEPPDRREEAVLTIDNAGPSPRWVHHKPAAEPVPPRPLAPSRPPEAEPPPRSPLSGADDRYRRGRLIHRLLELVPDAPIEDRPALAEEILQREAAGIDVDAARNIVDATFAVLSAPDAAAAFQEGSRAEVSIVGRLGATIVAGQVDRLAVTDNEVLVVDYKSNRNPPSDETTIPAIYCRQMAAYRAVLKNIYSDKSVSCYILWTEGPNLIRLSDGLLEKTQNTLLT